MFKANFPKIAITIITVILFLCAQIVISPQIATAVHPAGNDWKKADQTTKYDGKKGKEGCEYNKACSKCDKHSEHLNDSPLSSAPQCDGESCGVKKNQKQYPKDVQDAQEQYKSEKGNAQDKYKDAKEQVKGTEDEKKEDPKSVKDAKKNAQNEYQDEKNEALTDRKSSMGAAKDTREADKSSNLNSTASGSDANIEQALNAILQIVLGLIEAVQQGGTVDLDGSLDLIRQALTNI